MRCGLFFNNCNGDKRWNHLLLILIYLKKGAKNSEHSALFETKDPMKGWSKMLTCFRQNYKAPDERSHECQECHYCAQTKFQDISQHTLYRWACIRRQIHRVEEDMSINYRLERSEVESINCVWLNSDSRCADTLLVLSPVNRRQRLEALKMLAWTFMGKKDLFGAFSCLKLISTG